MYAYTTVEMSQPIKLDAVTITDSMALTAVSAVTNSKAVPSSLVSSAGKRCEVGAASREGVASSSSVNRSLRKGTSAGSNQTGCEVEAIVDVKKFAEEGVMYRVKWRGLAKKQNSWEPASNLNCPKLITDFLRRRAATPIKHNHREGIQCPRCRHGHSKKSVLRETLPPSKRKILQEGEGFNYLTVKQAKAVNANSISKSNMKPCTVTSASNVSSSVNLTSEIPSIKVDIKNFVVNMNNLVPIGEIPSASNNINCEPSSSVIGGKSQTHLEINASNVKSIDSHRSSAILDIPGSSDCTKPVDEKFIPNKPTSSILMTSGASSVNVKNLLVQFFQNNPKNSFSKKKFVKIDSSCKIIDNVPLMSNQLSKNSTIIESTVDSDNLDSNQPPIQIYSPTNIDATNSDTSAATKQFSNPSNIQSNKIPASSGANFETVLEPSIELESNVSSENVSNKPLVKKTTKTKNLNSEEMSLLKSNISKSSNIKNKPTLENLSALNTPITNPSSCQNTENVPQKTAVKNLTTTENPTVQISLQAENASQDNPAPSITPVVKIIKSSLITLNSADHTSENVSPSLEFVEPSLLTVESVEEMLLTENVSSVPSGNTETKEISSSNELINKSKNKISENQVKSLSSKDHESDEQKPNANENKKGMKTNLYIFLTQKPVNSSLENTPSTSTENNMNESDSTFNTTHAQNMDITELKTTENSTPVHSMDTPEPANTILKKVKTDTEQERSNKSKEIQNIENTIPPLRLLVQNFLSRNTTFSKDKQSMPSTNSEPENTIILTTNESESTRNKNKVTRQSVDTTLDDREAPSTELENNKMSTNKALCNELSSDKIEPAVFSTENVLELSPQLNTVPPSSSKVEEIADTKPSTFAENVPQLNEISSSSLDVEEHLPTNATKQDTVILSTTVEPESLSELPSIENTQSLKVEQLLSTTSQDEPSINIESESVTKLPTQKITSPTISLDTEKLPEEIKSSSVEPEINQSLSMKEITNSCHSLLEPGNVTYNDLLSVSSVIVEPENTPKPSTEANPNVESENSFNKEREVNEKSAAKRLKKSAMIESENSKKCIIKETKITPNLDKQETQNTENSQKNNPPAKVSLQKDSPHVETVDSDLMDLDCQEDSSDESVVCLQELDVDDSSSETSSSLDFEDESFLQDEEMSHIQVEVSPRGFARGLQPETVLACSEKNGQLMLLVKWQGEESPELVPAWEANVQCPQLVVDFYEKRMAWPGFSDNLVVE